MSEELVLRGHHTDYDGLDDIVDWIMELHNLWDDKSISMEDRISARKLMLAEEKLLLLALGYTPWEMEKGISFRHYAFVCELVREASQGCPIPQNQEQRRQDVPCLRYRGYTAHLLVRQKEK